MWDFLAPTMSSFELIQSLKVTVIRELGMKWKSTQMTMKNFNWE